MEHPVSRSLQTNSTYSMYCLSLCDSGVIYTVCESVTRSWASKSLFSSQGKASHVSSPASSSSSSGRRLTTPLHVAQEHLTPFSSVHVRGRRSRAAVDSDHRHGTCDRTQTSSCTWQTHPWEVFQQVPTSPLLFLFLFLLGSFLWCFLLLLHLLLLLSGSKFRDGLRSFSGRKGLGDAPRGAVSRAAEVGLAPGPVRGAPRR